MVVASVRSMEGVLGIPSQAVIRHRHPRASVSPFGGGSGVGEHCPSSPGGGG